MPEMIEIYDENHQKTGIIKTRQEVHEKGFLHKTIHVWVLDNKKRLLIQKRALSKKTYPGMWDVSCAGHISAGETPKQAAVKELMEETGLTANMDELQYITTIEKFFSNETIKDHEIYDVFILKTEMDITKLTPKKDEVEQLKIIDAKDFFQKAKTQSNFIHNQKEYSIMEEIIMSS